MESNNGRVNAPGFPGYSIGEALPDLPVILDGVRDRNPPIRVMTPPGERKYSGGGFLIAEMAMEDHCGRALEEMAEDLVLGPLGLDRSTFRLLRASDRDRVAVGYREDGSEVVGGWHQYPETAPASLWTTATEYAAFVADVMKSYEQGTGVLLDQETTALLLDPDFAVGFGVGRESDGISIGHKGANEGFRCEFVAVPHLGQGIVVFTNSDAGLALTGDVIDAAAAAFEWPWSGWSTPLWAVLLAAATLGAGGLLLARRRRSA